ncbi:hypothetical protein KIN20_022920 [Parelaphostrongylus tenuis]|uniref:Uncharacterized protein n=1 Tax=Parelaphostrongylus tenuis TaxID=148309 RepID=A0AAD5N8H2_PARTN|nr:hypothetical protein KIN20_022920 [Parelaphostrongylus tenuis]
MCSLGEGISVMRTRKSYHTPEVWNEGVQAIRDIRNNFSRSAGVPYFGCPKEQEELTRSGFYDINEEDEMLEQ